MKTFKNIGRVTKEARLKAKLSQVEACTLMGYKNGQFISNIERSLCSIPIKDIQKFSDVMKIESYKIKNAMVADYRESLNEVDTKDN
jgi:transcriptional regulator with XRE-family HTH domain